MSIIVRNVSKMLNLRVLVEKNDNI